MPVISPPPRATPINGILPGGTATINLTFTPGAAGARSGLLTITDNALGSPHSVNLNGTGAISNISPTTLTFAGQAIGTTSAAQTVTFAYPAGASGNLTLNSVAVSGANSADFTPTATPGTLTAFGQSRQISVTFAPPAAGGAGSRSATLDHQRQHRRVHRDAYRHGAGASFSATRFALELCRYVGEDHQRRHSAHYHQQRHVQPAHLEPVDFGNKLDGIHRDHGHAH